MYFDVNHVAVSSDGKALVVGSYARTHKNHTNHLESALVVENTICKHIYKPGNALLPLHLL